MLKRRDKQKLLIRIKQLAWPHMGLRRLLRYLTLRIVRLSHAPQRPVSSRLCRLGGFYATGMARNLYGCA